MYNIFYKYALNEILKINFYVSKCILKRILKCILKQKTNKNVLNIIFMVLNIL